MYYCICTSPKINMEAEDHPIARENHVPHLHFRVPCWFSEVYISYDMICLICKICSFAVFLYKMTWVWFTVEGLFGSTATLRLFGMEFVELPSKQTFWGAVCGDKRRLILLMEDVLHHLVWRINQNKSISYCFINSCRISFINTKKEP